MASFTVASWNIHGGMGRDGTPFKVGSFVETVRPAIVALQELQVRRSDCFEGERAGPIGDLELPGLPNIAVAPFSPSQFDPDRLLAVATLSSFDVVRFDRLVFPNPKAYVEGWDTFHDKGALVCTVQLPHTQLDLVALHLYPFYMLDVDEGSPQFGEMWSEIDDAIRPRAEVPRIVLGDFNTEKRVHLLASLRDGALSSVFDDRPTRDDGRSHDDILVSNGVRVVGSELRPSPSDHHLLAVTVEILPDS